jgi:hypothetical protein
LGHPHAEEVGCRERIVAVMHQDCGLRHAQSVERGTLQKCFSRVNYTFLWVG